MDKTLSYFVYSPPKSNSHGHSVRDKNVRRSVQKVVDTFIINFKVSADKVLQVTLYYDKTNSVELQNALNTIDKVNNFLGHSKREWDNIGYEYMKNTITWESETKDIFDILDYIDQIKSEEVVPLSSFGISYFYHYGKNDQPNGQIMCSIQSGKLFVRLYLIFPFAIDDKRVYELISKLYKDLPFKLNNKHFRRLGLSKNRYGQWKLDDETQRRLDVCFNRPKMAKC